MGHSSSFLIIKESVFILFSLEIKSLSISFLLSSLIISFIKISFDLIILLMLFSIKILSIFSGIYPK